MVTTTETERGLTLYELTGEYVHLRDLIDHGDYSADDDPALGALTEALDALAGGIQAKADGITRVYLQGKAEADFVDARADVLQEEVDRLRSRAQLRRNNIDRLKQYLAHELALLGDDTQRIKLALFSITLAKATDSRLAVTDPNMLPPSFRTATLKMRRTDVPRELAYAIVDEEIARAELNAAFKETGVAPPGTAVTPGARSLRIY